MRGARLFGIAILAGLVSTARLARAHDVDVELHGTALEGHDSPSLVVRVEAPVLGLELSLTASDGRRIRRRCGSLRRGEEQVFGLAQRRPGTVHYHGQLAAWMRSRKPITLPLSFEAIVVPPLTLREAGRDLAKKTATLVSSFAPDKMHVTIVAVDGSTLEDDDQTLSGTKAGDPIVVRWGATPGADVLRVRVQVFDRFGYWTGWELSPWHVDVPHQDVLFETGKSDIRSSETPKLDSAYAKLTADVQRYGRIAAVQLFISGFTDTVGTAADNLRLSEARARAIARYFRRPGLRLPIWYAGFGENGLAVPTPDETPEAKNRRAVYTIALDPPPGIKWTRLR